MSRKKYNDYYDDYNGEYYYDDDNYYNSDKYYDRYYRNNNDDNDEEDRYLDNDDEIENESYNNYNDDDNNDNDNDEDEINSIDDDLAGYFSDARIFSSKKNTDNTKKRAKKIVYKIDDKIVVSTNKTKNNGIVLFGPYNVNNKQMYQIELDNGNIIEIDDKHIAYCS